MALLNVRQVKQYDTLEDVDGREWVLAQTPKGKTGKISTSQLRGEKGEKGDTVVGYPGKRGKKGEDGKDSDMLKSVYDPSNQAKDVYDADNHKEGEEHLFLTPEERSKLGSIAGGADITTATNVERAGAVMKGEVSKNLGSLDLPEGVRITDYAARVLLRLESREGAQYALNVDDKGTDNSTAITVGGKGYIQKTEGGVKGLPISPSHMAEGVCGEILAWGWGGIPTTIGAGRAGQVLGVTKDGDVPHFMNMWQLIYPIGVLYMSTSSTDPSELFGGRWEGRVGRKYENDVYVWERVG